MRLKPNPPFEVFLVGVYLYFSGVSPLFPSFYRWITFLERSEAKGRSARGVPFRWK